MIDPIIFSLGFSLAAGVMAFIACCQLVSYVLCKLVPRDDSDAPKGSRSGFRILTDELTSVQYLQNNKGHLTLRVDQSGYPVTKKERT